MPRSTGGCYVPAVPARVVAACCLVVLAAACGKTLNADDLQAQIATQLGGRFPRSTWTVSCPDGVEPAAGDRFTCEATSDSDQGFAIEVTQDDANGSVTWRIVQG